MDVLADPNIINYLIIYASTHETKLFSRVPEKPPKVEFMYNFSNKISKVSTLATDLKSIRRNTDLLYSFMQFLKREGFVHLLQFCLDVGKHLLI